MDKANFPSMPKVTVLMSVYNGEAYLDESISSILDQTFKDFEFLIINDGSTDKSLRIINKYAQQDKRLKVISHGNKGLVTALNEGVQLARGKYIARMDADDISLPTRLEKQFAFLEANSNCSILATRVIVIDEYGIQQGDWEEDVDNVSSEAILRYLPTSSCLAHPSIMVRADVLRNYKYRNIPASEDYDLWLRLATDGKHISKLREPLLKYRMSPGSITQEANKKKSPVKKLQYTKRAFLIRRLGTLHFNRFDRAVLASYIKTWLRPYLSRTKRVLATPLIIQERRSFKSRLAKNASKSNRQKILFLVPWLSMGGAEKVMLDLVEGLSPEYEIHILITEQVIENKWTHRFNAARAIVDLRGAVHYPSNKTAYVIKYVAINHIDFVIISNSFVGYSAIPGIKKLSGDTKIIDILHGQGGRLDKGSSPLFSLPYHKLINRRVTVTDYLRDYMNKEFRLNKKDFYFIPNGVSTEGSVNDKRGNYKRNNSIAGNTKIVAWVGRFNDEKKPFLGLEIARKVSQEIDNCIFVFAGDGPQKKQMEEFIKGGGLQKRILLPGPLDNPELLLIDSEVLLLTSEMEGMPLAILEASAIGVPVVATKVGGVPEIVTDSKTGFLIPYDENSVKNFSAAVLKLLNDNELRGLFSVNSIQKARSFTKQKMINEYRKILESL